MGEGAVSKMLANHMNCIQSPLKTEARWSRFVIPVPGGRDRVGTWNSVTLQLGLFENIQTKEKPFFRNHLDKT